MDEGEVLEGFLCPICVVDLKTAVQLNNHFQEQHSDDQDLFKSVKDLYEKAKNKMYEKTKKKDQAGGSESEIASGPALKSTPGYRPSPVNIELGASRNHTDFFKSVRTFRMERYAAQTNNLLIRLEKLLINLPLDPVKRKAHEQKVVPWLNEKDVSLCPGCAKQFGLLRRKHHCRLCGAVMCNECTCLLPLDAARKMTSTSVASNLSSELPSSKDSTPVKKLLKSPSSASVQSVLSLDLTHESFFRLCVHCHKLLEIRQKLKEVRNQKSIISQFYERLRNALSETDPLLATYTKMYHSLCAGETTYSINDAQGVRVKILRLADVIDNISKKIAILGQNTENPPVGSQLLLQKSVRNSAAHYLKENIITLPSLPTEEQIQHYQEQRRLEMARKIEQAHEAERIAHEAFGFESRNRNSYIPVNTSSSSSSATATPSQDKKVVVEHGWTPDVNVSIVSDNPIIQQMNIIRGFIKQAKLANKLDEVAILEENLRELKEALYKQNVENNRETATSQN